MLKKTKLYRQHDHVDAIYGSNARVLVTDWRLFGILIYRSIEG